MTRYKTKTTRSQTRKRLAILQSSRGPCPPVLVYIFRLGTTVIFLNKDDLKFKQYLNERRRNGYLFYEA